MTRAAMEVAPTLEPAVMQIASQLAMECPVTSGKSTWGWLVMTWSRMAATAVPANALESTLWLRTPHRKVGGPVAAVQLLSWGVCALTKAGFADSAVQF